MSWLLTIPKEFRDELTSLERNNKGVIAGCELVNKWLDYIDEKLIPIKVSKDDVQKLKEEIEELKNNFQFLNDLLNGKINQSEWDNYDFDGNGVETFDGYLTEFWDFLDTPVYNMERPDMMKLCFAKF